VLIILGYIGAIAVLITAIFLSREYIRKHRKEFVKGTPPQTRSYIINHAGLFIIVLTPILFGLAWLIGWLYSR
jgi:hypothetical protein